MERVETLLKKINDLFASNASPSELLLAVQMLQTELLSIQKDDNQFGNIAVTLPGNNAIEPVLEYKPLIKQEEKEPEKIIEVLQVDEAEIEAELEEIKRNAEAIKNISIQNKPQIIFEDDKATPIFNNNTSSQKEINELAATATPSINDKLKQSKIDLGDTLTEVPIRDLKKAIDINDRFLFINELFRGDEAMYERSIKTINNFHILPEAEYWIRRELKIKIGWNDKSEVVQQFDQLVKRRFS